MSKEIIGKEINALMKGGFRLIDHDVIQSKDGLIFVKMACVCPECASGTFNVYIGKQDLFVICCECGWGCAFDYDALKLMGNEITSRYKAGADPK